MGYPHDWCKGVQVPGMNEDSARAHIVGNGFHLPSIRLLLVVLLGRPLYATSPDEGEIAEHNEWITRDATDTPFDPNYERLQQVATDSDEFFTDVLELFTKGFFPTRK